MARIYNLNLIKSTRLLAYNLVFFLLTIFVQACKHRDAKSITLSWHDDKPWAIELHGDSVKDVSQYPVTVSIAGNNKPILGRLGVDGKYAAFFPAIPFTPGMSYDIWQDGKLLGQVSIPVNSAKAPELLTIYPETDTVPENLLKLYLKFSAPMRTGQSLDYIELLDKNRDTLHRVFLNLQPELWDTTGTVLTLWIDPGRIKRDLVLNRELGNPLKKAEHYELVISSLWKDSHGHNLLKNYNKKFVAATRDSKVPEVNQWQLTIPPAGTKKSLIINTTGPLDHYLLQESITVLAADGTPVKGNAAVSDKDRTWMFTPSNPWQAQRYKLQVNARLEDLAGNNLNRVFDRDITKDARQDNSYFERGFEVKP